MAIKKQKTLLVKYLTISLVIVLSSFIILGAMLVIFLTRYSAEEMKTTLTDNAQAVSSLISTNSKVGDNQIVINDEIYQMIVSTISKSIDANTIIANNSGEIQVVSDNALKKININNKIPIKTIKEAQKGNFFTSGNMGGAYKNIHYAAGEPIFLNYNGENILVGVVFVTSERSSIVEFTTEIIQIFIIAAIATFFILLCVVGLFTYKMVKPLRQMAEATKSFAKGDFTVRVPVESSDEIGQLAEAFNHMADSLSISEGTRRSFIANVSHELKTPMTTIAGFIDGILDGTIPPSKQSYYLNIVTIEVRRLSRLVQSMLSLSRIDSGILKMQKVTFDLSSTAINTLLSFEQKIEEKHINIEGLENLSPSYVDGDADMIHQVIYNLIENAVKFTNAYGYIRVSLTEEPHRTLLSIENSGQGISSEEIVQIFDRFYKTDKSRSQDKNGMGLGLYIVKKIITLHNGDITVSSELGNSCTFTFWLPKENTDEKSLKAMNGKSGE